MMQYIAFAIYSDTKRSTLIKINWVTGERMNNYHIVRVHWTVVHVVLRVWSYTSHPIVIRVPDEVDLPSLILRIRGRHLRQRY